MHLHWRGRGPGLSVATAVLLCGAIARGQLYFPNSATIDYQINNSVIIGKTGSGTNSSPSVNIVDGGKIFGGATAFNSSQLTIYGGYAEAAIARDSAVIDVFGGEVLSSLSAVDPGTTVNIHD